LGHNLSIGDITKDKNVHAAEIVRLACSGAGVITIP
jgi:hypothetical protein